MKTGEILLLLDSDTRSRFERIENWLKPLPTESGELVERIRRAVSNATIAEGKAGYVGNPYEQILADLLRVQTEVLKTISNHNDSV